MIKPIDHILENARLAELNSYSILDTMSEEEYDNLTAIAAQICGTSISLVSLLDEKRQWFKSHHGLDVEETPKELAFCAHAINDPGDVFIIEDARSDIRFHDNPLVTGDPYVIFYAGVPLSAGNGLPIGTLCVIDHEPKVLTHDQIIALGALAKQVMNLLAMRRTKLELEQTKKDLEAKNLDLEHFAHIAAHDLKSPLNNIIGLVELCLHDLSKTEQNRFMELLVMIKDSVQQLKKLVDGLLDYAKSDQIKGDYLEPIDLHKEVKAISGLYSSDTNIRITTKVNSSDLIASKSALKQVLLNLITNAIKYNDKDVIEIEVGVDDAVDHYSFYVKDNGAGIEPEHTQRIFEIFEIVGVKDRHGNRGSGVGLATVKKLVDRLGGKVSVHSSLGEGSTFTFTIKK